MTDRSYYPENDSTLFIPSSNDVTGILRDNWQMASYRTVADQAGIKYSYDATDKGQTLSFQNSADKDAVEAQATANTEFAASLTHVETFPSDHDLRYIQAWNLVVPEIMREKGHEVVLDYNAALRQSFIKFDTSEAQAIFAELDDNNMFIDFALHRQKILPKEDIALGNDGSTPVLDQKITV